jgi:hypothetical protein
MGISANMSAGMNRTKDSWHVCIVCFTLNTALYLQCSYEFCMIRMSSKEVVSSLSIINKLIIVMEMQFVFCDRGGEF